MIFNFGKKKQSSNQETVSESNGDKNAVVDNFVSNTNSETNYSDAEKRKQRSIEILKKQNIPYFGGLPFIEPKEECLIRSAEEIAKRAITTLITIQMAYDISNGTENLEEIKGFFTGILKSFDLLDELTENEKKIFTLDVTEQEVVNMMWKYEAYWTLIWALGLVEKLEFPSGICDCEYAVSVVSSHKNFDDFMKTVKLREIDEILDETDLIYRYDWACVNARLKGEMPPANMDSSVVVERHRGLNWLVGAYGSEDWDNVQANT